MLKEPQFPARAGYRPDFRLGDTIVEVKSDVHSFRNLRAALLQLAYYIADETDEQGALVLVNPRITDEALRKEWRLIERTLHPAILKRLALAVRRNAEISTIAGTLKAGLSRHLLAHVGREARTRPYRAPQSSDAILQVLLNQWFLRQEAVTTRWLMEAVGCSYPTVAAALDRLMPVIQRLTDRRVKLAGFPAEEWQRLVVNHERAHPTLHYADRSGQRRSPESLLRRAAGIERDGIAVGGIIAARQYYPAIDLRGAPRLDLTLHSPDGRADLSFVEQLDPALERTSGKEEPAALAVHILRRQAPFFESGGDGLPRVDRVSTLLDLYDARLEPQAKEFLHHLVTSVG